jgi:hypothetical protein
MKNSERQGINEENLVIEEKVIKRIPLTQESYKYLKKMAIDLDMDSDGKISLDMIGACIDLLILKKNSQLTTFE